jgi:hypothetical protein
MRRCRLEKAVTVRVVPTRVHGAIDYAWGVALLLAPRLLHLPPLTAAARTAQAAGAGAITYAVVTDYELGLVPVLTMKQHLALDLAAGVALAASPWIGGFAERTRWLHVTFGLFSVCASLITHTQPSGRPEVPPAGRR